MIEDFVKAFFKSEKQLLAISITQESMVELALFNAKNRTVEAYAQKEVAFAPMKKMVEDMQELSSAIEEMKDSMGIKPKTPVVVNLPNFYFGFTDVDAYTQTDEDVKNAILAEVEQSYMFKQNRPIVDYCRVKYGWTQKSKAAFCAAQATMIEDVKNMLYDMDLVPVAIENSYSCMFKSLQYFGVMDAELQSNVQWGVVLINQNSYSVFSFVGDNLVDMTEDAVAIKTYEKNEVDYAVSSVINSSLQEMNFSSVIVINNSNDCSASEIEKHLREYYERLTVIENNGSGQPLPFRTGSKVSAGDINKISLYVIGAALQGYPDMEPILSFDLGKGIGEEEEVDTGFQLAGVPIELNDTNCLKLLFLALLPVVLLSGTTFLGVTSFNDAQQAEIDRLNALTADHIKEKERYKIPEEEKLFDPFEEINKVMEANIYNQKCYESLSVNIPKSIWLTYFYNNTYKATIIRGNTKNPNDIYQFFRDLKKRMNVKDLLLSKISVSQFDPDTYEFEITNKTYIDLVELIKKLDDNKDYQTFISKQEEEIKKNYRNSIFPLYPASDIAIKSPAMSESVEHVLDEEYMKTLNEFGKAPKELPPT